MSLALKRRLMSGLRSNEVEMKRRGTFDELVFCTISARI